MASFLLKGKICFLIIAECKILHSSEKKQDETLRWVSLFHPCALSTNTIYVCSTSSSGKRTAGIISGSASLIDCVDFGRWRISSRWAGWLPCQYDLSQQGIRRARHLLIPSACKWCWDQEELEQCVYGTATLERRDICSHRSVGGLEIMVAISGLSNFIAAQNAS